MYKIILSFFLLVVSISVIGAYNTDAHVTGHVVIKSSGEHVPFFNITVKGTTIGIPTDASGHYFLKNLPEGEFTLVASGIGYKTVERALQIRAGNTHEVDFEIEEDFVQLEGVVVSANRNEVMRKESPAIVNILSPKLFENTNSVCLAQGLNFQPGLRVETNCQNCGFQQVRINGLDGPYSQVLIDSRPIFSALAGVYGLEQIPANMVERVEVVRGGGSALFGSNAIAGTINIITKEPKTNSATVANTTSLIDGRSADYNSSVNASIVSEDYKTGLMLFGSSRQRASLDYDGDGFTEIGDIELKNIGFRGYYKPTIYSKLTFEYHTMGEFRRGGNLLDLPPHETDITEQTEYSINAGGVKYDLFSRNSKHRLSLYTSVQMIERESYYGAQKDLNAYGTTEDKTFVGGFQYTYSMDTLLFMPAVFTFGSEYSQNDMTDKMLGYHRVVDQSVNIQSVFLQNEWKNKKLSLLMGARLDKHRFIESPVVSPRFNLRYSPESWVNIRASYSGGFRAPQAFDEDLHISAVGGEVALIQIDEDLKTEKSQSISGSLDFYKTLGKVQTNLLIEGFYTKLDQVFVLEEVGADAQGNIVLERRNGSGAVVQGINLEGKVVPAERVQFQFGMTFQKSAYEEALRWSDQPDLIPQKKMYRAPEQYGYLTAYFQPFKPFKVALSGTYTGSMLVQHFAGYVASDTEKETPEFYDANIKLSYDLPLKGGVKLQLNGGVQNMFNSYQSDFDKGEFRDAGYIYGPSLPRTYFFGLKFMI